MGKKLVYGRPQEGELTAKKWREKGYKVKKSAKGVERWFGVGTHYCYTVDEVEFVGIDVIKKEEHAKRREADRKRRLNQQEE